jgi:hypothetical protein
VRKINKIRLGWNIPHAHDGELLLGSAEAVHGYKIMDEENDPRLRICRRTRNIYGLEVTEVAFLWGSSLTAKTAKIRG